MSLLLPGSFVYEPAELGFNSVTLPPASVTVTGLIVPWKARGKFSVVSWQMLWTDTGATPLDLFIAGADINGVIVAGAANLHSNPTNAIIPARGYVSLYANGGTVVNGGLTTATFSIVSQYPYVRFSMRNQHATIAITDMRLTVTVCE